MADCLITHAVRDHRNVTTHLGNPKWGVDPWPVSRVIASINAGENTFYTTTLNGKRADVCVVDPHGSPYLRTKGDGVPSNNLDNLPNYPARRTG